MKRFVPYITAIVFFGILTLFLGLSCIYPDRQYSNTENRALTQRPVMDLTDPQALTARFSDYVVDQFPFRERMLKAYSALELAQDKRFSRDTYCTEDGWLMAEIYPVSEESRRNFIAAIDRAAQSSEAEFFYAVLPEKNDALQELLEPYADNHVSEQNKAALFAALEDVDSVTAIDVGEFFKTFTPEERMQMYFRTDFHWNAYGAFVAATYIGEEMAKSGLPDGVELPTAEDFQWQELGQDHRYQGDLNRRFSNLLSMREEIPYYAIRDPSELQYYLSVDDTEPVARTEIVGYGLDEETLQYNGLFTDNLGFYRVLNPNARSDRHLLILKDSFQNPTIDYFTELFAEVVVIDPRYYNEPFTFSEVMQQEAVDTVLLMYHQNNASAELVEFLNA